MKTWAQEVRELATVLADRCGCRTWKTHRGVAIWRIEEREIRASQ